MPSNSVALASTNGSGKCASASAQATRTGIPWRLVAAKPAATTFNVDQNYGQVAQSITNKFVQPEGAAAPVILPGSIGSDIACYNYIEYLIERLAEFRTAGASYGQKRRGTVHPGVIKNQIKNERGALPKNLERELAEGLAQELKDKIDDTALGRNRRSKGGSQLSFV